MTQPQNTKVLASNSRLEVVRVRTRETLCRPEISQLIQRGARACGFPTPGAVIAELALIPGDIKTGTFIGLADTKPRAAVIGFLPTSPFWLAPSVALAYSEGPHALFRLVAAKLRGWFLENGHDHACAMNLHHPDAPYLRALSHFGRARRIGSVIEFGFEG